MWIASTLGFFSIVAHRDKPDHVIVRSRQRKDLFTLLYRHVEQPECYPIIELLDADYRFRVTMKRDEFAKILFLLADDIQYPNFKSAIGRLPDQRAKLHAYHNLWADLRQIQPVN